MLQGSAFHPAAYKVASDKKLAAVWNIDSFMLRVLAVTPYSNSGVTLVCYQSVSGI
jgi:hypothetical protein